jgi:hypothetical protein
MMTIYIPAEYYLPTCAIPNTLRNGRNVHDGYQRGCGLWGGDLKERITKDPLYRDALAVAVDRTVLTAENRMNIYLLLRYFIGSLPFGHIIEYGAYRGGNAIFMAYVAKQLHPGMVVFACDTFTGMPPTDQTVDFHRAGDFGDVDVGALEARLNELNLDNLVLVKGRFEDTNDEVMARAKHIRLAHIDCDIASAVRYAYEGVKPFMVPGGYYVFDDALYATCHGATEVVEDIVIRRDGMNSEQIWPHFVFRHPPGVGGLGQFSGDANAITRPSSIY